MTDTDRGNTGDTTLLFNIHNPPKISLPTEQINFEAGKSSNFSGISVFDVDTDEVFVTLSVKDRVGSLEASSVEGALSK